MAHILADLTTARVDKVLKMTRQTNAKRLPAAEQAKLAKVESGKALTRKKGPSFGGL